jgi:hypothetical protein
MRKISMISSAVMLALGTGAAVAGSTVNGPMAFDPIDGSAYDLTDNWGDMPFKIPAGYRQYKVSDERDLDIYPGVDDLDDMNSVNETGKHAGRFLYRTHEVDNGGAVSVVDLGTGIVKIIAQATDGGVPVGPTFPEFTTGRDLDGIRWTPWGTLLFAEEDPNGRIYEMSLVKGDPSTAADVRVREAVGLTCHEGIETGPDGAVYYINEFNGGSIYKFVPDSYGDLSSGSIYALKVEGISDARQAYAGGANNDYHTGPFQWVHVDPANVDPAVGGCAGGIQSAADLVNSTQYGRPEDLERIGSVLYVANTSETRVLAIDLNKQTVSDFVRAGVNVPVQNLDIPGPLGNPPTGQFVTGFDDPDNVAQGPDGRLWIVEDNSPSDIWVADPDTDGDGFADAVYLFASLRDGSWECDDTDPANPAVCVEWDDNGAEGTGIYFGKDPHTLFVNIQHAEAPLRDGTWAITNRNID